MSRTILVVDDKPSLREMVRDYLTENGLRILTAGDGQEALRIARQEQPDLILLDIMMPRMDGYEFLRAYAQDGAAPVIILTAKLEETDKVLGLEMGADDYVTKPFGMRELLARIRAVLRRGEAALREPEVLRAADVILDQARHTCRVQGRLVDLTPKEFSLLATLMAEPGRVFARSQLLETIEGPGYASIERSVNVHISNLRSKIEPDPSAPVYVETVYGTGYRFVDAET